MEQEEQLSKIEDTSGEINPYRELIVNNAEKIMPPMIQMEQWSILSNILNYIQHDRHHTMNHNLGIRAMNKYKNIPETMEEKEITESELKAEESFPISEHGYSLGKLLDGTVSATIRYRCR